ncbi:CgeB family protein [Paenibacillus daejeonensis]|uniref:CgeB family protein n=1 Tax=Paenibacillus daejeonensis TaxID=135193 RepID=UPI0003A4D52E|nr:glycosyltransferase [Paenibacillus daejeonensis]
MNNSPPRKIVMCYGKTQMTPGRYLEDALRAIGVHVDVFSEQIDFSELDLCAYEAVLFVETNRVVDVHNIQLVNLPKYYWITHGWNRLERNQAICSRYQPDYILVAQTKDLQKAFSEPVLFFPFALDEERFNCDVPLDTRNMDIGFVGSRVPKYVTRNHDLITLHEKFSQHYRLSLFSDQSGRAMAEIYNHSKIVYNHSPRELSHFNMRLFEGMGCGALVLTNDNPGQQEVFRDGHHYVIFDSQKDLLEKAEYYLTHLDQAQKIATQGRDYVLAHHTYKHRARQLLQMIDHHISLRGESHDPG